MSFFESSSHYRINGGNFSSLQGDTNEYRYDNSVQVDGQGNSITYTPQSYRTGSNIINNSSGQMTIIGQGDNTHIQLSGFGFQGNNGMYQMPQMHVNMPHYNPGPTTLPYPQSPYHYDSGYSSQGPRHFDPGMGQPQPSVPDRMMSQSNIPYVDQLPTPNAPSTATYTPETDVRTRSSASWAEPLGATGSSFGFVRPSEPYSYYTQLAPSQPPPTMPVPVHTPTSSQQPVPAPHTIPLPAHVPATTQPLTLPAQSPPPAPAPAVHMPTPSTNASTVPPTSPNTSPPTPFWNSPQARAITPATPRVSVRAAQPEVHRSPDNLSQSTAQQNHSTPYAYRAVDQTHAHRASRTTHIQDEAHMLHSTVSHSPVETWMSQRVPSPSTSRYSPPAQQPSSLESPRTIRAFQSDITPTQPNQITTPWRPEQVSSPSTSRHSPPAQQPTSLESSQTTQTVQSDTAPPQPDQITTSWRPERASSPSTSRSPPVQQPTSLDSPQATQTTQSDTISTQPNQIIAPSVASGSTSPIVQSPKTQEKRVSARPSEKTITGVHEHELSLDSMPPPAYSLEAETPYQMGEISQALTSAADTTSGPGENNQENQYSRPTTEVIRSDAETLPDIDLPLPKKKKKQGWRFSKIFTRQSKRNNDPAVEL